MNYYYVNYELLLCNHYTYTFDNFSCNLHKNLQLQIQFHIIIVIIVLFFSIKISMLDYKLKYNYKYLQFTIYKIQFTNLWCYQYQINIFDLFKCLIT